VSLPIAGRCSGFPAFWQDREDPGKGKGKGGGRATQETRTMGGEQPTGEGVGREGGEKDGGWQRRGTKGRGRGKEGRGNVKLQWSMVRFHLLSQTPKHRKALTPENGAQIKAGRRPNQAPTHARAQTKTRSQSQEGSRRCQL